MIFISTWYGPDTSGGSEVLCARLAEEMRKSGYPVEVFTTTSRGYTFPWFEPYYPEGQQEWNGVPIHRFPICTWEEATFFSERLDLLREMPTFPPEEIVHLVEMPQSDGLYRALARAQEAILVFFIYSHNLTFWGSQIAPGRTFLIPAIHDEPYAYHSANAFLMRKVRGHLCVSDSERNLALRLYDLPPERVHLVGEGMDIHWQGDAERFRTRWGVKEPFLLYVGRRNAAKQVPDLIQFFCTYQERRGRELKLLLAGPGEVDIPPSFSDQIVDLGYIPEQDKHDLYAAATVFCLPSRLEAFSRVLMEAWLQGTPALVNADCEVTVRHCHRGNGGLYYRDYGEFEACLDYLLERPALRQRMGAAGRAYVLTYHTWPAMIQRIVQVMEESGLPLERRSGE